MNKSESIGHDAAAAASLTGHVGTTLYVSPEMLKSDARYNQVCSYFPINDASVSENISMPSRYQCVMCCILLNIRISVYCDIVPECSSSCSCSRVNYNFI